MVGTELERSRFGAMIPLISRHQRSCRGPDSRSDCHAWSTRVPYPADEFAGIACSGGLLFAVEAGDGSGGWLLAGGGEFDGVAVADVLADVGRQPVAGQSEPTHRLEVGWAGGGVVVAVAGSAAELDVDVAVAEMEGDYAGASGLVAVGLHGWDHVGLDGCGWGWLHGRPSGALLGRVPGTIPFAVHRI